MRGIREKRQNAAAAINTSGSLYNSPDSSPMQFGERSSLSTRSSPYANRSARSLKESFLQTSRVPSFQLQMPQQSIVQPSPTPAQKYNPTRMSPRSSGSSSIAQPAAAPPVTPTLPSQQPAIRTTSVWRKNRNLPGAWAFTPQDPNRDKILSPFYSRFFQFFQESTQKARHVNRQPTSTYSPSPPLTLHSNPLAAHLLELHSNVSEVKSNLDALQKRLEILNTKSKPHTDDILAVPSSSRLNPTPTPTAPIDTRAAHARSQLRALRRLLLFILSLQMAIIWVLSSWWPTSLILDPSICSLFNPAAPVR